MLCICNHGHGGVSVLLGQRNLFFRSLRCVTSFLLLPSSQERFPLCDVTPGGIPSSSPAVVPVSSFERRANAAVIERALPPPVSGYLHFANMHKSRLRGYPR